MLSKKNIALIGIGYWGKIHLKYLNKIDSLKIAKIFYKKNKPNLNNKRLSNKLTNNFAEITKNSNINYIDIVTPIKTHAKLVLKLAKKNIDILVEKPLIMNKNEEIKISKLIKSKNKIIVSYPYLYSKTLLFAKKEIDSNVYGKLLYAEMSIQQYGRFLEYNVNQLLGPHAISILSVFYNINEITFSKNEVINDNKKSETNFIICKKKKKNIGLINLSINYANKNNNKIIKLFLSKGTILVDLNNKKFTFQSYIFSKKNRNKPKIFKNKKFSENHNMNYVINDFVNNKKIDFKQNFNLTKKINRFINS